MTHIPHVWHRNRDSVFYIHFLIPWSNNIVKGNLNMFNNLSKDSALMQAANAVENIITTNGAASASANTFDYVAGVESFDQANLGGVATDVEGLIQQASMEASIKDAIPGFEFFKKDAGGNDTTQLTAGAESLAASLILATDPEKWLNAHHDAKGDNLLESEGAVALGGVENFQRDMQERTSIAIVLNAAAATTDDFVSTLFPTRIVPAGSAALEYVVSIPYVFNRTARASKANQYELNRRPLHEAISDSTVFESKTLEIVPVATAENDEFFVDDSLMGDTLVSVGEEKVPTRALVLGKRMNLISLAMTPGTINQTMDETDTLDRNVAIGEIFVKLTPTAGTPQIVRLVTKGHSGSLLTTQAAGANTQVTANFNNTYVIDSTATDIASTDLAAVATALGAGADFSFDLEIDVSATAEPAKGNMSVVKGLDPVITAVRSAGSEMANPALADVTVELFGWLPAARISNANYRQRGYQIGAGDAVRYLLAVERGAPLATAAPVTGEGYDVQLATLRKAHSYRQSTEAVSKLLETVATMSSGASVAGTAAFVGAQLVKPTYLPVNVDLTALTVSKDSATAMVSLREALLNAITLPVMRLLVESGYSRGLQYVGAPQNDYEVIIATDPFISALIMESGDSRALGNGVPYRCVHSNDTRMTGKLFATIRRRNASADDIMNFGVHGFSPANVYNGTLTRGESTATETIFQPADRFHVINPVIAEFNVTGLEDVLVTVAPQH